MATINGDFRDNTLVGTSTDDLIFGKSGNDRLTGLAGDDTLSGGAGHDTMVGGLGNDLYVVDSPFDLVSEQPGGGTDTVRSTVSYTLFHDVENLNLSGSASIDGTGNSEDNVITGNAGANTLSGGSGDDQLVGGGGRDHLLGGLGNDFLSGGPGVDTMSGGAGNDTYFVDNSGDRISEAVGAGTDTVRSIANFVLSDNVENLTLLGGENINGTGNSGNNSITGNAQANVLSGENGNDIVNGGGGNDTLAGANGNDTLTGGAGVDRLVGGGGNDVLNLGDGGVETDTVAFGPGSGHDTVNGFDNTWHDTRDMIDVSAFGYTNFTDFVKGGGLILPNISGGNVTSWDVRFASSGESATFNVADPVLGITPANFTYA